MKNRFILGTIIGVFIFLLSFTTQQEGASSIQEQGIDALKQCSVKYLELRQFSIGVEYSMYYQGSNGKTPVETSKGKVIRKQNNFYQEQFGNITLINKNYQLFINEESKVINVFTGLKEDLFPAQINTDSIGTTVMGVSKISGGYAYTFESGEIEKMDVLYTAEGYMHTMRHYYRYAMDFGQGEVKVVTEAKYTNFDPSPQVSSDTFSEKKYVEIDKENRVVPVGAYKDFEVINHLGQRSN